MENKNPMNMSGNVMGTGFPSNLDVSKYCLCLCIHFQIETVWLDCRGLRLVAQYCGDTSSQKSTIVNSFDSYDILMGVIRRRCAAYHDSSMRLDSFSFGWPERQLST